MIAYGMEAHSRDRRRDVGLPNGGHATKSEWMESPQSEVLSPTVFLVEQPPGCTVPFHFHRQDQFQVFVRGGGTIGRHRVEPAMVHYARAYTGYGPIVSGEEGLFYFTLRAVCDVGAHYMPGARAEMKKGVPRRQLHGAPDAHAQEAPPAAGQSAVAELIPLQEDGIAARHLRLGADGRLRDLDPGSGGGQFFVVLDGAVRHGDTSLGRWESLFVSADEPAPLIEAGPDGASVVLLQTGFRPGPAAGAA